MKTTDILKAVCRDQNGATAVEYGLIASLVVIASLVALQGVADESKLTWSSIETNITDAMDRSEEE